MSDFDPFSLIGSALGAIGSIGSTAMQNAQSQKQMEFQERMSNTAHQREVVDLRKAGLNPILGYTKGLGGASTPPGSQATIENPLRNAASDYSAVNAARVSREQLELSSRLNEAQLADIAANIKLKASQANETDRRAELTSAQAALAAMDADPHKWAQGMRNLQAMEPLIKAQTEAQTASAKLSDWQANPRNPQDLWGRILSDTIQGKNSDFSIPTIIRRIWNGGQAEGSGAMSPAAGARHSAKPRR